MPNFFKFPTKDIFKNAIKIKTRYLNGIKVDEYRNVALPFTLPGTGIAYLASEDQEDVLNDKLYQPNDYVRFQTITSQIDFKPGFERKVDQDKLKLPYDETSC